MASITFTANGLDISGLVAKGGYKWAENDLHSESSGRTLDGVMHVIRIGTKAQLDVSCRPMTQAEARSIIAALRDDVTFSVTYPDPVTGTRSGTFYCSARNADFLSACRDVVWWQNLKFTLTEC